MDRFISTCIKCWISINKEPQHFVAIDLGRGKMREYRNLKELPIVQGDQTILHREKMMFRNNKKDRHGFA